MGAHTIAVTFALFERMPRLFRRGKLRLALAGPRTGPQQRVLAFLRD